MAVPTTGFGDIYLFFNIIIFICIFNIILCLPFMLNKRINSRIKYY